MRDGDFYPSALEKGLRSERALTLALAEMYVQGVSTRKVKMITEQLCGSAVSSSHVSRAAAQLDEVLQAWRQRPLGTYVYLFLDARYEHVRVDGQVRDAAVLIAAGVNLQGKRELLGVSVALSEQEADDDQEIAEEYRNVNITRLFYLQQLEREHGDQQGRAGVTTQHGTVMGIYRHQQ